MDEPSRYPDRTVVECRDVRVALGARPVLDGLNLTVRPGRVYALLGRNGAGKSTTFSLLLGLRRPDSGQVRLFGEPWCRDALAHVGASIDGPALYGHLSASENLLVHARLTGRSGVMSVASVAPDATDAPLVRALGARRRGVGLSAPARGRSRCRRSS
ncbi:ATP-binding cassette domain-containing protein [Pseudonocardia sediminis]|uniref:ATP-binding cassette domain-containing protein n=1 Tax=Pseudonocardia sediminis TaxID=1397368 RepID=UPI001028F191|nr:ATP-binding cassette domain-containing protein [Pseudonocardia sediminis]